MVLSHGETIFSGDPTQGIESYYRSIEACEPVVHRSLGTGEATLHNFSLLDEHGNSTTECQYARPYHLSLDLTVAPEFPEYDISITFMSRAQELVAQCHSRANREQCRNDGGRRRVEIAFNAQLLNPGRYWINVAVFDRSATRHLCWEFGVAQFTVHGGFVGSAPVQMLATWRTTPVVVRDEASAAELQVTPPNVLS